MKQHDVPPPRRKSCSACVKAKRRCDMLLPQCTRCFQKKANCVYNGQAPRDRRPASMSATTATTTAVVIASSASASCAAVPFSINRLTDPLPVTLEVPDLDFHAATFELHDSDNADFGFSSFVPCLPVPPCPASFPAQHSMRLDDRSIQIYTHDDYSHVEDICDEFNVGQLNDDTSRIACAVAAIRNWHRCMAFSCSTPFLHRKLYSHDRPNLISDVFASCLMYATKTAQTEDVVVPLIENKACALIIEYSRHQVSPTLSLARVQALLLYLSIREAHYVERDLPILETWLASLASLRDQSLQLDLLGVRVKDHSGRLVLYQCALLDREGPAPARRMDQAAHLDSVQASMERGHVARLFRHMAAEEAYCSVQHLHKRFIGEWRWRRS
ncbi:hypothetical protein, variant [Verruconis gallopava]|uniref:Zn(2)-C6 fungal-type domain-containing protein n=1 Tax=Verruconis gallopava TaxID=253628 RepID=A0A0D2AJN3_9PEZI|nr:hypothetical protein, variant [Verruconis gallopava]KIV99143.1 hypothetical protein, variant [Verruconis gallopava]